ncbi:MAG: hypothetical protein KBG25_07800 [Paludibacteraceae bacterium]|nr:hypothetical protein [Paludibacteraceae bacterium]
MIKTYKIRDNFSTKKAIRFNSGFAIFEDKTKNGILQYSTSNKNMQNDIENSDYFLRGIITCTVTNIKKQTKKQNRNPEQTDDENDYSNVTTFKQARDILSAKPYNVPLSSLRNQSMIFAKAEELGINFPNLKM